MTWAPRGLLATYRGETSDKEVTELARRGQADERFGELRYVLHDFTACTGATYSTDSLTELSAIDSAAARSNSGIHIIVVARHPDILAMVDIYRNAGFKGFELSVFDSLPKARQFLAQLGLIAAQP